MNSVGELLDIDDIDLDADVADKISLLQRVAAVLARRQRLPEARLLEGLIEREQLGSTGLGHGVAIPHARTTQCEMASVAFVRSRVGIPFDAPDGRPVTLFLGLIVPKDANERHLKLLATAADMFSDRAFRGRLMSAADRRTLHDLVEAWPQPPEQSGDPVMLAGAQSVPRRDPGGS